MLKRPITYVDFNEQTVTEEFYFNISRVELIEVELDNEDGLKATIDRIIASKDMKSLVKEFKKIILDSYGIKSDDGKRFVKSPELREEFSQTAAFDVLFLELATNDSSAADFIKGVLPSDLAAQIEGMTPQDKPKNLPRPVPPMPPTAV